MKSILSIDSITLYVVLLSTFVSVISCGNGSNGNSGKSSGEEAEKTILEEPIDLQKQTLPMTEIIDPYAEENALKLAQQRADSIMKHLPPFTIDEEFIKKIRRIPFPDSLIKMSDNLDTTLNIYFDYDARLEGYRMYGRLIPYKYLDGIAETGIGIFYFENPKTGRNFHFIYEKHSSVETYDMMEYMTQEEIRRVPSRVYHYKYRTKQSEYYEDSPLLYDTPYQFMDVDFDGKAEFVYNGYSKSRGGNDYYIFDITPDGLVPCDLPGGNVLYNDVEFNYSKKSLTFYAYDGASFGCKTVFKRMPKETALPDNTEFTENKLFEEHVAYWAIKDYYRKEKSIWRLDSLLPHCQYLSDTTLNYEYVYVCKDGKLELVEKRKTWNTTDEALQELWGKSEK